MGYSYAAKAGYTMDSIGKLLDDKYGRQCSNGMPDGGFYDYGREQRDRAITGTVWAPWDKDPTRVVKRGSFRIDPNGRVKRFPGLSRELLQQAERMGAAIYAANYGTWRERAAAMLPKLESGEMLGDLSYSWLESIAREWQSEKHIMFATMPHANNESMVEFLRGILD